MKTFDLTSECKPEENEGLESSGARGGLKILVVDDEPFVAEVFGRLLQRDGHQVDTAEDGSLALAKFHERRHPLVISDRSMPEMNGDELAISIKATGSDTKIIMITGYGAMMNATGERPEGVDLVVSKPLAPNGLRAAVSEVLNY